MDLGPTAVSRELKRLWQKTHIYIYDLDELYHRISLLINPSNIQHQDFTSHNPWSSKISHFFLNPGAVLFLGTADTVSRLAVLRHSDTLTAASLDAGLMPLATLMARACGASFGLGATLPTEARKMLHQWLIDLIAWYRQINSGFCGGFSLIDNCGWENDLTCKVSI